MSGVRRGQAGRLLGLLVFGWVALAAGPPPSRALPLKEIATAVRVAPSSVVPPAASVAAAANAPVAAAVTQPIQRGVLYHVDLSAAQESSVTAELARRLNVGAGAAKLVTLPGALTQQAADGAEVQLKPLALVDQALARGPTGEFVGSIKVGVIELGDPSAPRQLTAPIPFEVLGGARAEPSPVNVTETSPPFQSIAIRARSVGAGLRLRVASTFNPEGVELVVPVEKALTLIPSTDEIDGFGLEAADLNVVVSGLDAPKGTVVDLQVSGRTGYLERSRVVLDDAGEATTQVRSSGLGPVTVIATSSGFEPYSGSVRSRLPTLTFAAAALGGLIGGLIRLLSTRSRRRSGARVAGELTLAVLMGFVVFGLYAVGVNVLPVTPTVTQGATLVGVVAALGGFLGTGLITPKAKPAAS